ACPDPARVRSQRQCRRRNHCPHRRRPAGPGGGGTGRRPAPGGAHGDPAARLPGVRRRPGADEPLPGRHRRRPAAGQPVHPGRRYPVGHAAGLQHRRAAAGGRTDLRRARGRMPGPACRTGGDRPLRGPHGGPAGQRRAGDFPAARLNAGARRGSPVDGPRLESGAIAPIWSRVGPRGPGSGARGQDPYRGQWYNYGFTFLPGARLMANERPAQQSDIKLLISKGLEQGYLTYAEVNDHLPDDLVDPEQIEDIIGMINGMGIEVHEVAPDVESLLLTGDSTGHREVDDTAAEEAAATLTALDGEGGRTTDPVRMYMREMGTVELLTREGEIAIAKRIEEGLNQMLASLASFPWSVQLLLEDFELHKAGKKRLAELVVGFNDGEEPVAEAPAPAAAPAAPAAATAADGAEAEEEEDAAEEEAEEAGPTGPDPAEVARRMEALAALYTKFQKTYAKSGAEAKPALKLR